MFIKINKFIALLFMLCLGCTCSFAQEAEFKKLSKTWTLHLDGSQEYRYEMELKIYTHTAMNGTCGESFVVYNPEFQELKINESYTRQVDGTIVKTPANAFVEVLPRNAADAPAYNHLKEMVIVHTGLELGATICLDYTLKSKPGYLPEIDVFEKILQSSPVREYTLTMVTPEAKTLNYTLSNQKAKASVKKANGMRSISWKLSNLPASSTSAFVAVANGDVPYLAASTYASPKAAMQVLTRQFDNSTAAVLKKKAQILTKDRDSEAEKIRAIWNYVNHGIALTPLTMEQTGYRLRPAENIVKSVYATELEKVNLLCGLLNAAGIKAEGVVGYPAIFDKGLGLKAVDRLYVKAGQYLLNVSSLSRPQSAFFGVTPLYEMSDGLFIDNLLSKECQIKCEQRLSFDKGQVKIHAKEQVGKDLLPYFVKGDKESEHTSAVRLQDGYATVVLQESAYGLGKLAYGHLSSQRNANLRIPRPVDETYIYHVDCPENMRLVTPQSDHSIRNAAGEVVIKVDRKGNAAVVTRVLKLNKMLYTPKEFKALRVLLAAWSDTNAKTLVFKVK